MHLDMFVCLYVCPDVYLKNYCPIELICLHNKYYPMDRSSYKMIQIGFGCGFNNVLNESSQTEYANQSTQ